MNKINYTSNYLTKHSRDFYRGQSIHYSGKWTIGSHYIYDNYEIDFVVQNNVLLACSKSHLANIDNKPTDFIYDERGTVIGINSDCWDFVLAGIIGKEGKIYLPSYDKNTGVLTWHLISKDEAEEESIGGEIPMSLAGLKDDENHRVVTDVQISSWEKVVSDLSDFINEVTTKSTEYVKKINNPFAVGSGTQSAFQKNPEHPNIASGNSSVAMGADNEATKIGSFAANRKNHATGDDSNATGYGTTASGDTSHAEGHYTTASGKYSHTEGHGTTASNDGTHAEGWNSKATGDTSHAEGHGSVAGGARSHAEGKYTQTSNDSEHAQGAYNKSNTGTIHSIGIGTSDANRKNAVEVLNNGNVYITGIGNYNGTNPSNNNSLQSLVSTFITKSVNDLTNYFTKTEVANLIGAINQFHYEIYSNLNSINNPQTNVLYLIGPSGDGIDKYEEYVYTVNNFVKIGDTSIDLSGYVTTDALNTALANYTPSVSIPFESGTGKNSAVLKVADFKNEALGRASIAEGEETKAIGDASHAEGLCTITNNMAEHAFGVYNKSNKASDTFYSAENTLFSIGMGFGEDSRGNAVEVMQNSDVYLRGIGDYDGTNPEDAKTLKEVIDSKADSTDLNDYATISDIPIEKGSGQNSVQQKNTDADASGEASVAFNMGSASGEYSFAEGYDTTASGDNSHAEGGYTQAKGIDSHAEGYSTIANNPREHAEGQFNVSNLKNTTFGNAGNTIHSVGIGANANDRKNAIEIMQNGDIYMYGIGEYDGTNVNDASTLKAVIDSKSTFSGSYADLTNLPEVDLTPMLNSSNLVTSNGVYSKIHNLSLEFSPSNSALLFKSDNAILSTVGVSDFSISGILNSASLSNDVLTLNFSSGDSVTINLVNVLFDVLTEYKNRVQTLQNRHTALSETAYELLAEKDPDTFYYIYEE